jgi:hypothetical protein
VSSVKNVVQKTEIAAAPSKNDRKTATPPIRAIGRVCIRLASFGTSIAPILFAMGINKSEKRGALKKESAPDAIKITVVS